MQPIALFFLAFLCSLSFGARTRPIVWTPAPDSIRPDLPGLKLLLAALEGETCTQAIQEYVNAIRANQDLRSMENSKILLSVTGTDCSDAAPFSLSEAPVLLLGNEFAHSDMEKVDGRRHTQVLADAGAKAFILPVGATLRLGLEDRKDFLSQINSIFVSVVALGGDDIDPSLYGEPIQGTEASEVHPVRDRLELEILRSYQDHGKGVFYGYCRGHQLSAVANGASLIQDIPSQLNTSTVHRPFSGSLMVEHLVHLSSESLLSQDFLGGTTETMVNSFHHQAVAAAPRGGLWKISAYEQRNLSSASVIEAMERRDGRVITFQFHPEWMASDLNQTESAASRALGKKILKAMIAHAKLLSRYP